MKKAAALAESQPTVSLPLKSPRLSSLWLIRHGPAGRSDLARWPDDGDRPLTDNGRARLKTLRRWLAKRHIGWDQLLASPLLRAHQSAKLLQARCSNPLLLEPALAPAGDLVALWQYLRTLDGEVAVVGHSPDLEGLAAHVLGLDAPCFALPKGAVVKITVPDSEKSPTQRPSLELLLDTRLLED
jgi:phosphohistidine phosphatase